VFYGVHDETSKHHHRDKTTQATRVCQVNMNQKRPKDDGVQLYNPKTDTITPNPILVPNKDVP